MKQPLPNPNLFIQSVITCVLILSATSLFGQPNFSLPKAITPDEAKISRFVDYPMDYCTGLPDITIPLYEVKIDDIVLPITLKYHAAGFRPCENYSNVGLGWSLFAEPSFTQNTRGAQDGKKRYSSFAEESVTMWQASNFEIDEQSDLYRYRLLNNSGMCLWDHDRSFVTFPYEPVYVSRTQLPSDLYFSLTDPQGLLYTFGGLKEWATNYNHLNANLAYKCISVHSRKSGGIIKFRHSDFPKPQYHYVQRDLFQMERKREVDSDILKASIQNSSWGWIYEYTRENCSDTWDRIMDLPILTNISETNVCHLDNMETRNEIVQFRYISLPLKQPYNKNKSYEQFLVNEIIVTRKIDKKRIRTITLSYSTFAGYYPKLDKVSIYYHDKTIKEQNYVFGYYKGTEFPSSFSTCMNRIDQHIDEFGFYNSLTGDYPDVYSASLPTCFGTVYATGNPRSDVIKNKPPADYTRYNTNDAMLFTLNEIKLPHGGKVLYQYEGNAHISSGYKTFAGLRVKEIIHQDSGKYRSRSFVYGDSINPSYGTINTKWQEFYYYTRKESRDKTYELMNIYRNPVIPVGYSKAPIIYWKVDEYVYDGKDVNSMKIERYFHTKSPYWTNSPKNSGDETGMIPPEYYLKENQYGLLTEELHYKKEKGVFTPVKQVLYDYNLNVPLINNRQKIKDRQLYHRFAIHDISGNAFKLDTATDAYYVMYKELYSNCLKPISKITLLFDQAGDTLSCHSEKYSYGTVYPYMEQLERVSTFKLPFEEDWAGRQANSAVKRKTRSTQHFSYPFDFRNNPLSMVNCLSVPIQITDSMDGKFVSRTFDEYKKLLSFETVEKVASKKYFNTNLQDSSILYFDIYDSYGNVLEAHKKDYPVFAFHYGYGAQYMVASIENYTLLQLKANVALVAELDKLQEFMTEWADASSRAQLQTINRRIRSLLPVSAQIFTYTYNPMVGMTSQTNPQGETTYYEYDELLQLKTIRNQRYEIVKNMYMHIRK